MFEELKDAFAGRYLLESAIGEGGSARVYAAQDLKHDRRVAIKILRVEVAQTIAADRFLREIRVDAALQHPRILPLFDSGEVLGLPYFVMPYVGGTLRARLQREGPLPVADAVRIATQIADALQHAHGLGFVHRDVKPENILLQDEHVWLADFGIARALQGAITGNVTLTGTAVGTPTYMSPEQRIGLPDIDARSDQFSLACVLYEMLVGRPPNVFERSSIVPTPEWSRVTPARALRDGVPQALDDVLACALQIERNERWPSMQAFADRLTDLAMSTPRASVALAAGRRSRRRVTLGVIAGAALLVAIWIVVRPPRPLLDSLMVAVLPLAHEGDGRGTFLDGDDCSRFLRDAIGRWTGIHHVDDMRLRDAVRRAGRPESLDDALKIAKQLGAGLAVWGIVGPTLSSSGSTSRSIRLFLYDVGRGSVVQEVNGTIAPFGDIAETFQRFLDSLLAGRAGARHPILVRGSRDLVAVTAYLSGHRALDAFDLPAASKAFRRAVDADPTFGSAFLWLAWSALWTPESNRADWGLAASRALAAGSGLSTRDSLGATALVSMYEKRFKDACDLFRSAIKSDPNDFEAWYGLGECLSSDYGVEPSTGSPSGWQFRTSMNEAIGAYERAVALAPSFTNAMGQRAQQRIARWLYAQVGRYRPGLSADSIRFAAWPSLAHDTLAFVPFAERAVFAESSGTRDVSYQRALQQNRDRVIALANRWVGLDSASSIALETLALARETTDELLALRRSEVGLQLTGFAALRRARATASGEAAVRLATTEVRFLIKTDRYADAKTLADSLLSAIGPDSANAGIASSMHSMAMLTGRVAQAVAWGRHSAAFEFRDPLHPEQTVPPGVSAAGADAATFAALGAPADSLRAAIARTERALVGQVAPTLELTRQLYVEQPLLWAWPSLGPAVAPPSRASAGNRWLTIQLALARGDSATARRDMWQADSSAARGGLSEIGFEIALVNSRLWLALGDTASARRVVGTSIDLVRTSGDQLIRRPTATAAFVRLLVQQAALALASGDTIQARASGSRAWVLWRDADPMLANELRPVLRWRGVPIPGGTR